MRHPEHAVGVAYYAMLYAVRAALSEIGVVAKTHTGAWNRFAEHFARASRFDPELLTEARRLQGRREAIDYDAAIAPPPEADEAIAVAERFVAAVADMLEE